MDVRMALLLAGQRRVLARFEHGAANEHLLAGLVDRLVGADVGEVAGGAAEVVGRGDRIKLVNGKQLVERLRELAKNRPV